MKDKTISIYFAHPKAYYNTNSEMTCMGEIYRKFFEKNVIVDITNPNKKWISEFYLRRKRSGDKNAFDFFRDLASAHDITVGLLFSDNSIGAGVAEECLSALQNNREVFILSYNDMKFKKVEKLDDYKILTIEETSERNKKGSYDG